MAPAGEIETFLGIPPNSACARLPGVWTERVGMPLTLLCLDTKISNWGVKKSVINCVFMISSLTKKKTYAGVGIFMSFFVLTTIGSIFATFDQNWSLVSPTNLLFYSYDLIYGFDLPSDLNSNIFGILVVCILFLPLVVAYIQVYRKEVGK